MFYHISAKCGGYATIPSFAVAAPSATIPSFAVAAPSATIPTSAVLVNTRKDKN